MHLENDELLALANAEYIGTILENRKKKQKEHLAECRECYKKFCIYITMLNLMGNDQEEEIIYENEIAQLKEADRKKEHSDKLQNVILQIQIVGMQLLSIQTVMKEAASYWNFLHMPQVTVSRGTKEKEEIDIYTSIESEYSQIRKEEQKLIIQLDDEVFPVESLRVRYQVNGNIVIREFEYNEEVECYEVIINQKDGSSISLVEIIKL